MEPRVYCFCPTYCRQEVLETSIFLFENQTYPNRILYILDDAGEYVHIRGADWIVISFDKRFPSLPSKYNYLFNMLKDEMKDDDIVAVWEDDDIYLPRYLEGVVESLKDSTKQACKHFRIYSWYMDRLREENGLSNTFHSCLAFKAGLLKSLGGWIETQIGAFDFTFLNKVKEYTELADSSAPFGIQFVYRFSGICYHGSAFMNGPLDTTWYDKVGALFRPSKKFVIPTPRLDPNAKQILMELGYADSLLERTRFTESFQKGLSRRTES